MNIVAWVDTANGCAYCTWCCDGGDELVPAYDIEEGVETYVCDECHTPCADEDIGSTEEDEEE